MASDQLLISDWLSEDAKCGRTQIPVVRPQQLSCWTKQSSREGGGLLYGSTQGLGTFEMPGLPLDLNTGFPDKFVKKVPDSAPVEQVVQAICHYAHTKQAEATVEYSLAAVMSGVQVVTFRNNLNKIFGTLAHPKDEWTVDACARGGVMYLDIVKTEEKGYGSQDLMTYYGYKFETVCTRPASGAPASSEPPLVDSTSEFATLVRLQLEDVGIIMAAEIDLTDGSAEDTRAPDAVPPLVSYLELKVYRPPQTPAQNRTLVNWKWSKWWLQSFLAGVPTLVLGQRDDQGTLHKIEHLEVQTMPAEARRQQAQWDAWQMLRCGTDLLRWMKSRCEQQAHHHLRFQYKPGAQPLVSCLGMVQDGQLPGRLDGLLGSL